VVVRENRQESLERPVRSNTTRCSAWATPATGSLSHPLKPLELDQRVVLAQADDDPYFAHGVSLLDSTASHPNRAMVGGARTSAVSCTRSGSGPVCTQTKRAVDLLEAVTASASGSSRFGGRVERSPQRPSGVGALCEHGTARFFWSNEKNSLVDVR
jgi:hypothetical protein